MLTAEQIDAIHVDDMNAAIATALGLHVNPDDGGEVWVDGEQWCPAYNWDHAMDAAERFGLWEKHGAALQISSDRTVVMEHTGGRLYDGNIAEAATGPMAICRAILKLHRPD